MRLLQSTSVIAMALFGFVVTAAEPGETATHCERMLDLAQVTSREAGRGEETLELFDAAFRVCEKTELSAELKARVAARQGNFLHLYRNDTAAAIAVYEKGLREILAAEGADSAARIELLDGLASALESTTAQGKDSASDRTRSIELREESLAVRRAVFGDESPETVRGLLLLGFAFMPEQPDVAEQYVMEAVTITSAEPSMTEPGAEALAALSEVYRQQGREEDALAAAERAGDLFAQVYPNDDTD